VIMKRICDTSGGQWILWFVAIAVANGWFGR
jgi:hypothetical protein